MCVVFSQSEALESIMSQENSHCDRVSRIAEAPHVLVWGVLGVCVAAATFYDVSHWMTGW
jgi:hypothetical protein